MRGRGRLSESHSKPPTEGLWRRRDLSEQVIFKPKWSNTKWLTDGKKSIPGSGNSRCQGRGGEKWGNGRRLLRLGCSEWESRTGWGWWGGQAFVDHRKSFGFHLSCKRKSIKNKRFELGRGMIWFRCFKDLPCYYLEKNWEKVSGRKGDPLGACWQETWLLGCWQWAWRRGRCFTTDEGLDEAGEKAGNVKKSPLKNRGRLGKQQDLGWDETCDLDLSVRCIGENQEQKSKRQLDML